MNEFTCYHEDGSVDVFTSKEAYGAALERWAHERQVVEQQIGEAVDKVLRCSPGRVALPKLVNMTLVELRTEIAEYDAKSKAVEAFIKANTSTETETKRYSAQKGKAGGYSLTPKPADNTPPSESD